MTALERRELKKFKPLVRAMKAGADACIRIHNRGMFGRRSRVRACFVGVDLAMLGMVRKRRWKAFWNWVGGGLDLDKVEVRETPEGAVEWRVKGASR